MQTSHGFKYVDSAESIDAAIVACVQAAEALHRESLDLRTRRNAVVPTISRLPPETLAEIFLAFEQQYLTDSFPKEDGPQRRPIGWIQVTHVCRHWRDLALDTPRLWWHVPMLYNNDICKIFLERSKCTPLYITPGTIPVHDRLQPKLSHLLDSAAYRIRSLQLRCTGFYDGTSTSRTWDAPLLETIYLSLSYSSVSADFAFLTGATLPKLKNLFLRSVHTDLCTALFRSTLTRLVVGMPCSVRTSMQWAGFLEQMPLLEHLALYNTMEPGESFEHIRAPPPSRKVIMAHLSSIDLADSLDCICKKAERSVPVRPVQTTQTSGYTFPICTIQTKLRDAYAGPYPSRSPRL